MYLPGIGIRALARDAISGALTGAGIIEARFDEISTGVAVSPDSHLYFARRVYARAE